MENTNTTQKKIPYGSNVLINCPSCGFKGEPLKYREGRTLIEFLLWFLLLIPGVIYTAWRHINTICVCPKCGESYLEETDGDTNIVNSLIKIKRGQTIRFRIIVIFFSTLGLSSFLGEPEIKTLTYNKQNYGITKSVNNLTDFSKYNQQINDNINNTINNNQKVEQKKEESIVVPEVMQEVKEPLKDPNDEAREKIQNVLKEIDYKYGEDIRMKKDSYIGASCSGDCVNGIINIKFAKNIGRDYDTIRGQAATRSNKIIKAVPGYFDKIEINYIFNDQNVGHCVFTEYQSNPFTAKGCEYNGYKDTEDEAREKMQNIIKETDKEYSSVDGYIGTTCLGDCINGVINVNFSKNIGWWDFTVKSHAAMLNNKIIKSIPGFFDKIWISFIYDGQTVCSCIFTEYQDTIVPKGCTYYGYKE